MAQKVPFSHLRAADHPDCGNASAFQRSFTFVPSLSWQMIVLNHEIILKQV